MPHSLLFGTIGAPIRTPRGLIVFALMIFFNFGSILSAQNARPDSASVETMKQAFSAYRDGDIQEGDRLAASLSDPWLRVTTEWAALRILQDKAGFERLNAFLTARPDWPTVTLLRRRAEESLSTTEIDTQTVLAFFRKAEPLTPAGRYHLASALQATGKTKEASELIRRVWRNDALPPDIESKLLERFGKMITQADRRARLATLLETENWGGAERNAVRDGLPAQTFTKAMIALAKKEIDVKTFLKRVPAQYRNDEITKLFIIQSLRRADKLDDAAKQFLALPKQRAFAKADAWWTERRVLARRLFDARKHALALNILAESYPLPQNAKSEAAFLRGLIELNGFREPLLAAAEFDLSLKSATSDHGKARAAYWRGLSHEAANMAADGDFRQAASLHFGYYGFLARERLGDANIILRKSPTPDFEKAQSNMFFQSIAALMAANETDSAITLAGDIAEQMPNAASVAALAALGRTYSDSRFVMMVGREGQKRGMPFDEEAYPVDGFPDIPQNGVEAALVYGITRQESTFDPRALSPVGARGLMQLMVATAQETAKRNAIGFEADKLLNDPAYNVLIGTTHLGELLETWSGSYILTIASYNAGAANVRRWVEAYGDPRNGGIDPLHFVERIPFSETRNYVQRVLENIQIYRLRIDGLSTTQVTRDLNR